MTATPISHRDPLPASITYQDPRGQEEETTDSDCGCIQPWLRILGNYLRDSLYLPVNRTNIGEIYRLDQLVAQEKMEMLQGTRSSPSKKFERLGSQFSIYDTSIRIISTRDTTRIFKIRVCDSKEPIKNKHLRFLSFSFSHNEEQQRGEAPRRWEPLTIKDLSESPLLVLQALGELGIKVDTLMLTSLGALALNDLQSLPEAMVPNNLILNRALTSIKKISSQLLSPPLTNLVYGLAHVTGWDADPERGLLNFIESTSGKQRRVIVLNAQFDNYFSGRAGFDASFEERMKDHGADVYSADFFPHPFQVRSHHAADLKHLENNQATQIRAYSDSFSVERGENAATAIARDVLLSGDEEAHTCLLVGGNDATLDVMTIRDLLPLVNAVSKQATRA